jgi:secreted trypsin-like serine protease
MVIDESSRIVGGFPAQPHEFPWQVALMYGGGYFCGGSLICETFLPDWDPDLGP